MSTFNTVADNTIVKTLCSIPSSKMMERTQHCHCPVPHTLPRHQDGLARPKLGRNQLKHSRLNHARLIPASGVVALLIQGGIPSSTSGQPAPEVRNTTTLGASSSSANGTDLPVYVNITCNALLGQSPALRTLVLISRYASSRLLVRFAAHQLFSFCFG